MLREKSEMHLRLRNLFVRLTWPLVYHARECRDPIGCTNCLQCDQFCRPKTRTDQTMMRAAPSPPPPPAPVDDATPTDLPLQHILVKESKLLHTELCGCLARVESLLARAETVLGNHPAVSDVFPLPEFQVGSADGEESCPMDVSSLVLHLTHRRCLLGRLLLRVRTSLRSAPVLHI